MSRTGSLIVGAFLFAAAAAGVLVWTNFFDISKRQGASEPASPSAAVPASREMQLVTEMNAAAAAGGFAASFLEADISKWQVADGHRLERFSLDPAGPSFARLTSSTALDTASNQWPSLGLSVGIPFEFAKLSNGRKIEVGFVARSAQSNGSPDVTVVYATQQAGNSGWQAIPLQAQFELHKVTFDVPAVAAGYTNAPIIVMHSDATGGGRSIEIIGVYVKLLP